MIISNENHFLLDHADVNAHSSPDSRLERAYICTRAKRDQSLMILATISKKEKLSLAFINDSPSSQVYTSTMTDYSLPLLKATMKGKKMRRYFDKEKLLPTLHTIQRLVLRTLLLFCTGLQNIRPKRN